MICAGRTIQTCIALMVLAPLSAPAVLVDVGTNVGTMRLGGAGTNGATGTGGGGGAGGLGLHPEGLLVHSSEPGKPGNRGGTGGAGGAGASADWTLQAMPEGEAFVNRGSVVVGGASGAVGAPGAAGAKGGAGGAASTFFFTPGAPGQEPSPDPDPATAQGGAGGSFIGTNGAGGTDGGGGGGAALNSISFVTTFGGTGGTGLSGSGGNGSAGTSATHAEQTTVNGFANDGSIVIGGDGGDGGRGGNGGSGGGGGGGSAQNGGLVLAFTEPGSGGAAGAGGSGGAAGAGGDGSITLGAGGVFVNEAAGSVTIGRGAGLASGQLTLQAGSELSSAGTVTVDNGSIGIHGSELVTDGSLAVNDGTVEIGAAGTLANGGILTLANVAGNAINVRDTAELSNGGTLTVGGLLQVDYGGTLVNQGTVTVTGGVIELGGGATVVNDGALNAAGHSIATGVATTIVNNGLLDVTSLANNGFLSGSGEVRGDLENYLFLAPGNSVGSLSIGGNYTEYWTLNIELGGVGINDFLQVEGNVLLASLSALDIDFIGGFGASELAAGDAFDIIRYAGSLSGAFGRIDPSVVGPAWLLDYGFDLGGGWRSVRLTYAAPIPGSAVLLGSALGGLMLARRRMAR